MNPTKTCTVSVSYKNETTEFELLNNTFGSLFDVLGKSYANIQLEGTIHYIDDEGDVVFISSEEDYQYALSITNSTLQITIATDVKKRKNDLNNWLIKHHPENSALQPVLTNLINKGYKRNFLKSNFEVIKANGDDISKTIAILDENLSKVAKLSKEEKLTLKISKQAEKIARKEAKLQKQAERTEKQSNSERYSGKSKNENSIITVKPGDWNCTCGEMNFARRTVCRKCGTGKKPAPTELPMEITQPSADNSAIPSLERCIIFRDRWGRSSYKVDYSGPYYNDRIPHVKTAEIVENGEKFFLGNRQVKKMHTRGQTMFAVMYEVLNIGGHTAHLTVYFGPSEIEAAKY